MDTNPLNISQVQSHRWGEAKLINVTLIFVFIR